MVLSEQTFLLKSDVRFRRVVDEGVVLRQTDGEVIVVNAVGVRILELIGSGEDAARILAALEAEFDVDAEILRTDLENYLEELAASGVLEPLE